MKGLLIKDFMLLKNQKSFFIVILVMAVCFSGTGMDSSFLVSYLTFMFSLFTVSLISYDEYENGYSYLFTLPVSRKDYVREKYCFGGILSLGSWCVGILLTLVSESLLHLPKTMEWTQWWITSAVCLCVSWIFLAIMIPIRLKFEGEKGRLALPIMAGAIFCAVFLISKLDKSMQLQLVEGIVSRLNHMGSTAITVTILCVTVVFLMISYQISLAVLKKREF